MITIEPCPAAEIRLLLSDHSERLGGVWTWLTTVPDAHGAVERRPFVQLSADELPGEEVDQILRYAGIPASNAPVGLPFKFDPVIAGEEIHDQMLLFPLEGLEDHIRSVASDICSAFDAAGSMDMYVEQRGEAMSAREYLVGGVMDCIRFCTRFSEGLVIRW